MTAPQLRVAAGALKGRRLATPKGIRPSEGKLKAALFSIWQDRIREARFLDLFAGSGAVGIEAVSRGALEATFVESDGRVAPDLRRNLELLPTGSFRVRIGDVAAELRELALRGETFDLVFADPPYARTPDTSLLEAMAGRLSPGGRIAFEHSSRVEGPLEAGRLVRIEVRRYGAAALSFYGAD